MIACTSSGFVPKVGGISADSMTPSRPLVPAPTKMIRPPFLSAWVIMSMPTTIRSFSRWTAAIILRSSAIISSTMSAGDCLSIASVAGLMASVGRDCHFERTGMLTGPHERTLLHSLVVSRWSIVVGREPLTNDQRLATNDQGPGDRDQTTNDQRLTT